MKTLILALLTILSQGLYAQHDHSSHDHTGSNQQSHKNEPPHGGEIRDVGKYHVEIVFDITIPNENMTLYILKSNFKTLDIKDASGTLSVKYNSGKEDVFDLVNNGIDKLYCNIKDIENRFNAIIKITFKGKEYGCTYFYKGLNK